MAAARGGQPLQNLVNAVVALDRGRLSAQNAPRANRRAGETF